jgi:CAAX protease family protein
MENIPDTTRSKLINRFIEDQHSLLLSVGLHLIPGVLILVAYLLIGKPFVQGIGYPPYLAWVIAMCLALVPSELGLLLYLGWKKNAKLSLHGVVHYMEKPIKRSALIGFVIALTIGLFIAASILTPVDSFIYSHLFSWMPFESIGGAGGYLGGSARSTVIVTLTASLILTGMILPAIEELYFRGYLLPRLSRLGRWAPIVNVILFSLYHLWTPWQFISRIGFFLPTVWVTWRNKDLRVSLWVHCLSNTIVQLLVLIAILVGASL